MNSTISAAHTAITLMLITTATTLVTMAWTRSTLRSSSSGSENTLKTKASVAITLPTTVPSSKKMLPWVVNNAALTMVSRLGVS